MGLNYQNWRGFDDSRFGYGRHWTGYTEHAPRTIRFHDHASVSVWMGIPIANEGFYNGQHRVLHTMWETDALPSSFLRYLPFYDQIIVPCEHNRALFAKHHFNVHAVPEGVDRTIFYPRPTERHPRFQFRAGGSLWQRKGLDVVVKAFNKLGLPDADLRIKAAPHARDVPTNDLGPNIYLDRQWMTDEEQVQWFAEADCFVAASRGEGWGLMPLQTIAMAVPTILSETSGHLEFIELATRRVPCRKTLSYVGRWDEPDLGKLMEAMLWVYENRGEAREIARVNAEATDELSWWEASKKLVDCLPHGEVLKNPVWNPFFVQFTVDAVRDIKADIGDQRIRQKRGDRFTVSDGAYQVLFDAGVIVPVDNAII